MTILNVWPPPGRHDDLPVEAAAVHRLMDGGAFQLVFAGGKQLDRAFPFTVAVAAGHPLAKVLHHPDAVCALADPGRILGRKVGPVLL